MTYSKPLVIDIYHGDSVTDVGAVKEFGILGVIHKATEGTVASDIAYAARRKKFTDLGLKWGAYHFFHGSDPIGEADHFLSVAEPNDDTLVALDWENVGDSSPNKAQASAFLGRIIEKLGRKAVIYSGNVAKEQISGQDEFFGSHRLWLCQYSHIWHVQESWTRPWLWQNNGDNDGPGPHRIPGIAAYCDNNCIVDPMTVDDLLNGWSGLETNGAIA